MWWLWTVAHAQVPQLVGTVDHAPIDEQSGIVQSRRWPGVFWVHNDDGAPALFAIDAEANVILPPYLSDRVRVGPASKRDKAPLWSGVEVAGTSNIDWEDVAVDGEHVYLADTGNNGNARRDLGVYVLVEPNPRATDRARVLARWPVGYPEQQQFPARQWHYDCEAVFVHDDRLYFLTKHRVAGQIGQPENGTNLYRLDTRHTDRVNALTLVDRMDDIGGWVTGADLSPSGGTLAVLVYAPKTAVWLFETPAVGDGFLHSASRTIPLELNQVKQAEGIAWVDETTLLITNEQRQMFRLDVAQ